MKAHRRQHGLRLAGTLAILFLVSVAAHAGSLEVVSSGPILDDDGISPLIGAGFDDAAADLVQCIYAGPNGVIDPPGLEGLPSGDDQLLSLFEQPGQFNTVIGEGFPFAPDSGAFVDDFSHKLAAGAKVYVRAWNAPDIATATYYGDSALYTLANTRGERHDFGGWVLNQSRARYPLTLTINPGDGGTVQADPAPGSDGLYADGTDVQLRAVPGEGYDFGSWSGNVEGTSNPSHILIDGPKSVAANFRAKRFTLTIQGAAGGSVIANPPPSTTDGKYAYGTKVSLTAQASAGYTFTGWDTYGTNPTIEVTLTSNLTVKAHFAQPRFALASVIAPANAGTVSADPAPGSDGKYAAGTAVTITAHPASGYAFSEWGGAASGTSASATVTLNEDTTVIANFVVRRYSLVVTGNPAAGGTVTADPAPDGNGTYSAGTAVTLTAHPAEGYGLTSWGGDATGKALTTSVVMNANKSATANFVALRYQLVLTPNPSGAGSVAATPPPGADGKYSPGTVVTLTPSATGNYQFDRWSGDLSGNATPISITMSANKSVGAIFRVKDSCRLSGLSISAPEDGAHIIVPPDAQSIPLTITSDVVCSDDTAKVSYAIDGEAVGSATTPPYAFAVPDITVFGVGDHQIVARAISKQSSDLYVEAGIVVTLEEGTVEDDSNSNGLPDNPFTTLKQSGDTWVSNVSVSGSQSMRTVSATRWDGTGKADGDISLTVQDPANAIRRVTVKASRALVQAGETGILVVEMAPDLVTLLGAEQAALVAQVPEGGLANGGRYAEVSILISQDGGVTYSEVGASRLTQYPVHLSVGGVLVTVADTVDFYSYPTMVDSDPATGLVVMAENGAWSSDTISKPSVNNSTLEADMTSLSVVAPFNVAPSQTTGCSGSAPLSLHDVLGDLAVFVAAILVLLAGQRMLRRRSASRSS